MSRLVLGSLMAVATKLYATMKRIVQAYSLPQRLRLSSEWKQSKRGIPRHLVFVSYNDN